MRHLYEVVIESSMMWMKIQTSCQSVEQATAILEARFGWDDPKPPDARSSRSSFSTPIKLSQRCGWITNWNSVECNLPSGWDDYEFRLIEGPYPWCESMSDDCNCQGTKGRIDAVICSAFGLHDDREMRKSKSSNARHLHYIRDMEERIASRDRLRREEISQKRQHTTSHQGVRPVVGSRTSPEPNYTEVADAVPDLVNRVNRLVAQRFYCPIEGRYHHCSEQTKRKLLANTVATAMSLTEENRQVITSFMDSILQHWLKTYQSEECAEEQVRGELEVPAILYKYIPRNLIGKGAPESLRATQLLALNDDMECNVVTMNIAGQLYTLDFLTLVQSRLEQHLGIEVPWDEILERSLSYGDLRLSTFIQEYLNPKVGVVSFSTDILVPTMWAHYARNTGIVVGYDTEILRSMGFELRPMIYSEIAPTYQPSRDDTIRQSFVDQERIEERARLGETSEGQPIIADANLAEMDAGWKSLSRLLFVKGMSWAYEKEVRLLVELEQARDIGKRDDNGWPIKVIDPPTEAIKEIYRGAKAQNADVERAVEIARGENKSGLFIGRLSSHAFRIQKTVGSYY